jgi:hypothetical protein
VVNLPGDTENSKFAQVLGSAQQWLLAFCMSAIDAHVLGFDLPKDSGQLPEPGGIGLDPPGIMAFLTSKAHEV